MNRVLRLLIFLTFCSVPATVSLASFQINGPISLSYNPNVIDLRADQAFNRSLDGSSTRHRSMADLEIGSVFIDPEGDAYKVTDIYFSDGRTVIETCEPGIEEVFTDLDIPQYEITIEEGDLVGLAEGVSTRSSGSSFYITFNKHIIADKSGIKTRGNFIGYYKRYVVLDGVIRITGPTVSGHYSLVPTSVGAKVTFSQSVDVTVTSICNGFNNISIPLYSFYKKIPGIKVSGMVYLRILSGGTVSLEVLLDEKTSHTIGANATISLLKKWKVSPIVSNTYDFGLKPTLTADGLIEMGPSIYATFKGFGLTLASVGGNTGIRLTAKGRLSPKDKIGYNNNGFYGNVTNWTKSGSGKIEAFANSSITLLKKKRVSLFNKEWPLWTF